jgi:hypothetical protein
MARNASRYPASERLRQVKVAHKTPRKKFRLQVQAPQAASASVTRNAGVTDFDAVKRRIKVCHNKSMLTDNAPNAREKIHFYFFLFFLFSLDKGSS